MYTGIFVTRSREASDNYNLTSNLVHQLDASFEYIGWLVVLRINVALAVFQPYRDLEAGDNQSLKFKWRGGESNPGPLAPQPKRLTTRPPLLQFGIQKNFVSQQQSTLVDINGSMKTRDETRCPGKDGVSSLANM